MAWTHVREAGTAVANNVSSTTLVFTVGASGCQVGDTLVAIISSDNSGTNGAAPTLSVSDTGGNSWSVRNVSLRDPGLVNEGVCTWTADCLVTTALVSGNTITATFNPAVVAKSMSIREFAGGAQTTVAADRLAGQNGTNGSSAAPTASLNPAVLTDYLMIGAVGVECGTADTFTQDTDTTNGTWVSYTRVGAGLTTSGNTVAGAYKIVTANGGQTYNPTLGTIRDWAEKMTAYRAGIDLASGDGVGTSSTTADLTVTSGAAVDLASTDGNGTSSTTADLIVTLALEAASGIGASTTTADAVIALALASADAVGVSTTTADAILAIALGAQADGVATTDADLTVTTPSIVDLEGSTDGSSTTVGDLVLDIPLAAASGIGTSTTTADLTVPVQHALEGTAAGVAGTTATLTVGQDQIHRAVLIPWPGRRGGRMIFTHPH
jgi:hypothetical protein